MLAHRLVWLWTHGPAGDLCVLHHCDNRRCVNPKHLFKGTKKDNSDDMIAKGRDRHPSKMQVTLARRKLTEEQINQIREQYAAGGVRQADLAKQHGVNQPHISRIVRGVAWKP